MKNDRLFAILYHLLNRCKTTAQDLAEQFEVSVRTIYRDVDTLCRAGIPIYTERGKNGGIFLMENCVLEKTSFAKKEQEELIVAVESAEAIRPDLEAKLSQKLRSFFDARENKKIQIDFTSWNPADKSRFVALRQAVLEQKMISFFYHNSQGIASHRKAAPLQLNFKSSAWYLVAYCLGAKAIRTFKLNRIQELKLLEEPFPAAADRPQPSYSTESPKNVTVKMKISSHLAYRVYNEFTSGTYHTQENGDFLLYYHAPENEWLYGYLLSFHPYAEILEPAHIRNKIQSLLKASLAIYCPQNENGFSKKGGKK